MLNIGIRNTMNGKWAFDESMWRWQNSRIRNIFSQAVEINFSVTKSN